MAVPEAEVRDQLRRFICTTLMRHPSYPLEDGESIITGGLIDSFCLAHLAVFMETAFDVYVPDSELTVENMDTLDQIVARVQRG